MLDKIAAMHERDQAKHTPGPWRYPDLDNGNFRVYAPDGPGHQSGPVANAMHRAEPYERQANAHLIAAAPDLLAALERSTQYIMLALMDARDNKGGDPKLADADLKMNQAAIAKARGE